MYTYYESYTLGTRATVLMRSLSSFIQFTGGQRSSPIVADSDDTVLYIIPMIRLDEIQYQIWY